MDYSLEFLIGSVVPLTFVCRVIFFPSMRVKLYMLILGGSLYWFTKEFEGALDLMYFYFSFLVALGGLHLQFCTSLLMNFFFFFHMVKSLSLYELCYPKTPKKKKKKRETTQSRKWFKLYVWYRGFHESRGQALN